MDNAFISYVLVWWILDGIGLLVWSSVSGPRSLLRLGISETIVGVGGVALTLTPWLLPRYLWVPMFVAVLALTLFRLRHRWPVPLQRRWSARWREIGEPAVWSGWVLLLTPPAVIAAVILQILWGPRMTAVERTLWSWVIGTSVAAATTPGAFGLGANPALRWTLRLTTPACLAAAIILRLL